MAKQEKKIWRKPWGIDRIQNERHNQSFHFQAYLLSMAVSRCFSGRCCYIFFSSLSIYLPSQALASLYVVRQYIASSIGKQPLEWLIFSPFQVFLFSLRYRGIKFKITFQLIHSNKDESIRITCNDCLGFRVHYVRILQKRSEDQIEEKL